MAETPNTTPNQTLYATLEKVGQLLLKFLKMIGRGVWRIRRKVYRFLMLLFYKYRYNIPEPFRRKHTLIIWATGSGKSEFIKTLIHQHLLKNKTAIVALDPNGDFAEQVAQFKENARPERAGKLTYINPSEFEDVFPVINPLDLPNLSTETLDKVTQALHKSMMQSFKELEIKLTGAMDGMLYNMIHTLYRKEGSSLLDLVRFIDDEQNSDLVQLGMQTDNYVIKDYFAHKFMDTKMSVTKHGLANRLNNFLAAQSLQRLIIWTTTIDLKREINQKNLIVFNLSKGKLGTKVATIYGRFIITTILNLALARADIEEKRRVHFHVYVDEFQNFLSDTFIEVFAEGRKYKTFLTVATQVVGLGMSSDMKKAVLGNANVKIVGNAGYSSREEMIKQMSYIETEKMKKKGIRKRSFAKLKVGRFIVQYGIKNVFKIKVPKFLLGNKHAMKAKYWEAIRARLKRTKYVPPFYHQATKKKMPYPKYPSGKRSGLLRQNSASPRDFRSQLQA